MTALWCPACKSFARSRARWAHRTPSGDPCPVVPTPVADHQPARTRDATPAELEPPRDMCEAIKQVVRLRRAELGLSQEGLSRRLGGMKIDAVEGRAQGIRFSTLEAIAYALGFQRPSSLVRRAERLLDRAALSDADRRRRMKALPADQRVCRVCGKSYARSLSQVRNGTALDACSQSCARLFGKPPPLFEMNGEMRTLSDWSRRHNVSVAMVRARIARGWPLEHALDPEKRAPTGIRKRYVSFEDNQVAVCDLARAHGLHPSVLRARLNKGWSIECAVSEPVQPRRPRMPEAAE